MTRALPSHVGDSGGDGLTRTDQKHLDYLVHKNGYTPPKGGPKGCPIRTLGKVVPVTAGPGWAVTVACGGPSQRDPARTQRASVANIAGMSIGLAM